MKTINGDILIKDYEIKFENNQEVLYLYIDFNSEFAKLDSKYKKRKLKKYIKDYIKRHNINFRGTTVAIMVSGVMIGTIVLNHPNNSKQSNAILNKDYIVSIVTGYDEIINDTKGLEKKYNDKIDIKSNQGKSVVLNKKNTENNNKNEEKINFDNIKNNNVSDKKIALEEQKEYVKVYRTNGEVLEIELEDYILGVVAAEMPASFDIEALKAQAILARTYTLKAISNGKKITDDSNTQNYKSNNELKSMWGSSYNSYYNKVKDAVNTTKGAYLSYNGNYIEAVYHSTSNGKTENSKNVWGITFPYLVSVDSLYDNTNKSFIYEVTFTNEEVTKKLGQLVNEDTIYNITSRNETNRVENIFIDNIIYSGVELRTKLGLRSTDFDIEKIDNGIMIITRGYGHGVGMSQYGANGMAHNGYDYKSILLHYYKGVTISYR